MHQHLFCGANENIQLNTGNLDPTLSQEKVDIQIRVRGREEGCYERAFSKEVPFDKESIMLYDSCSYSKHSDCEESTPEKWTYSFQKSDDQKEYIPRVLKPSNLDKASLRAMYEVIEITDHETTAPFLKWTMEGIVEYDPKITNYVEGYYEEYGFPVEYEQEVILTSTITTTTTTTEIVTAANIDADPQKLETVDTKQVLSEGNTDSTYKMLNQIENNILDGQIQLTKQLAEQKALLGEMREMERQIATIAIENKASLAEVGRKMTGGLKQITTFENNMQTLGRIPERVEDLASIISLTNDRIESRYVRAALSNQINEPNPEVCHKILPTEACNKPIIRAFCWKTCSNPLCKDVRLASGKINCRIITKEQCLDPEGSYGPRIYIKLIKNTLLCRRACARFYPICV